jgi:hypothetical protein
MTDGYQCGTILSCFLVVRYGEMDGYHARIHKYFDGNLGPRYLQKKKIGELPEVHDLPDTNFHFKIREHFTS